MVHASFALLALGQACSAEWRGVDMSHLYAEDNDGGSKIFRADNSSEPEDALNILAAHGANVFRFRVFNDPCADGWCEKQDHHGNNVEGALAMAKRCKDANLDFIPDLHYSDSWADAGKQYKPTAWKGLSFDELSEAVYDYTYDLVAALVAQGTPPAAVQIGNEITNGMLFDEQGETCDAGAKLECDTNSLVQKSSDQNSWQRLGQFIAQGIRGARAASSSVQIAIHTDLGNYIQKCGSSQLVDWYTYLMTQLESEGLDFDLIGVSMYPKWDDGNTLDNIKELKTLAASFPGKKIFIAETAVEASGEGSHPDFAASPQGQLEYLQAVFKELRDAVPTDQLGGLIWWQGIDRGCGPHEKDVADGGTCFSRSLFDENYVARPALLEGFQKTSVGFLQKHGALRAHKVKPFYGSAPAPKVQPLYLQKCEIPGR